MMLHLIQLLYYSSSSHACVVSLLCLLCRLPSPDQEQSRSAHELSGAGGLYDSLPRSLKEPCAVRTRTEDPELQRERAELTRSKTPSQLAQIRGLGDIPIPGTSEARARNKRYRFVSYAFRGSVKDT